MKLDCINAKFIIEPWGTKIHISIINERDW